MRNKKNGQFDLQSTTTDFSRGNITSNGGVLLLKQADTKLGLTRSAARGIPMIGAHRA